MMLRRYHKIEEPEPVPEEPQEGELALEEPQEPEVEPEEPQEGELALEEQKKSRKKGR